MRIAVLLAASALVAAPTALADTPPPPDDTDTLNLGLEDLMKVVVTSVSKKSQTLADTAAAAYVITADDIHRSGATNLPEALRLAPGVQVSALGNNKWAVSIRGFADRFANKLLVLVDGRSVYTPLFSGVLWETLDVPLETIARIEVIRGPGASIWGANAVNGVINIITRPAFDAQGGELALAGGTEMQGYGMARFGWTLGPDTALSLRAMAENAGPSQAPDGRDGYDDWLNQSVGFGLEQLLDASTLRVEGSAARSLAGDAAMTSLDPPSADYTPFTQRSENQSLMARWETKHATGPQQTLQFYATHSILDHVMLLEHRTTADLEYQQQVALGSRHDLIWGLGYRYSEDRIRDTPIVEVPDQTDVATLYSVYAQDEITLQPQRWRLSVGARLDYNDATHLGVQPNVRLLWTPDAAHSAWISVARAIRTPSRMEQDRNVYRFPIPSFDVAMAPPTIVETVTGPLQDEEVDALDVGWRGQLGAKASLDIAGFYYHYDDLRGGQLGPPAMIPPGYLIIPTQTDNSLNGHSYGAEVSLDWCVVPSWRLQANYSWLHMRVRGRDEPTQAPSEVGDVSPTQQFSLRSALDLPHELRWDAWLRAVSRIPVFDIPGYVTLDMRLAWAATDRLELSLVGQNLLDAAHPEFGSLYLETLPTEIERGAYARIDWKF